MKAPVNQQMIDAVKAELAGLEGKFHEKLEKTSRDRLGLEVGSLLLHTFLINPFKLILSD